MNTKLETMFSPKLTFKAKSPRLSSHPSKEKCLAKSKNSAPHLNGIKYFFYIKLVQYLSNDYE